MPARAVCSVVAGGECAVATSARALPPFRPEPSDDCLPTPSISRQNCDAQLSSRGSPFSRAHTFGFGPRAARTGASMGSCPRSRSCFREDIHKTVVPALTYLGSIWVGQQLGIFTYLFGARPEFVDAPTFGRFAIELVTGVFMYDLLFYPFHRSFHASQAPLAWRQQHNRHHRWGHEQPHAHNACETVQNSYLDAGIQVMINIFVQNISPWGFGAKHPLSRVAHNLMVTYLLSEAHSGYDLPFQSHRIFPRSWRLGPARRTSPEGIRLLSPVLQVH